MVVVVVLPDEEGLLRRTLSETQSASVSLCASPTSEKSSKSNEKVESDAPRGFAVVSFAEPVER